MDTLLTIVFFIVAAILSAIMKKKQSDATDEESWPREPSSHQPAERPGTTPAPRRESWEDELRRLLEGKTTARPTASPPPPVPPPPPPPLPPTSPSVPSAPKPSRSAPPAWLSKVEARKEQAARKVKDLREKRSEVSIRLQKSMDHLRQASQLDDRAAMTIRRAANRIHFQEEKIQVAKTPGEIKDALNLLQSRESLRTAMIASVILGPPKALEFESGQSR